MTTTPGFEYHDVLNHIIKMCDESSNILDYNDEDLKLALKEYNIDESDKHFKVAYFVSFIYVVFMNLLDICDQDGIAFNFETKEFNIDEQHRLSIDVKQFILAKHGFRMFIPKDFPKENARNVYKKLDSWDVLLRMAASYEFWDTDLKIKNYIKDMQDAYLQLRIKWTRSKIDKSKYIEFQPDY